jgi:peroxiredoxin family protein
LGEREGIKGIDLILFFVGVTCDIKGKEKRVKQERVKISTQNVERKRVKQERVKISTHLERKRVKQERVKIYSCVF